jgi:hypothetical protein
MTETWVRRDRRVRDDAHCLLCGDYYGICSGEHRAHPPTVCLACGTAQCWTQGLSRGTCGVCYVGLLPRFSGSDRPCGYVRCANRAVAVAPRVKNVCREHLARAYKYDYVADQLATRDQQWERIVVDLSAMPKL